MTAAVVGVALAGLVLLAWLATAGFLRGRTPLDRMHCVSLLNGGGSLLLVLAVLFGDGFSDRAGKVLLLALVATIGGAAASHAIARALRARGSAALD